MFQHNGHKKCGEEDERKDTEVNRRKVGSHWGEGGRGGVVLVTRAVPELNRLGRLAGGTLQLQKHCEEQREG